MPDDVVISVENLSKCYRIWNNPSARIIAPLMEKMSQALPRTSRLSRSLQSSAASRYRDFAALQNVSFQIKRGESVGIIGRNGSGKSTLLQIIAGTLQPTSGAVRVNGRIAALLELGCGFNPEFTGRENAYLNGAILGLSRQEVESRFDRIAAFADIGDFIDQPVKTYSSGMQVRLAFAVSINVAADIIIVDEALSVGDVNFQAKCITALRQLQERGVTFLIVTHGIDVMKSMCDRGVYLKQGIVSSLGAGAEVADVYFREMREQLSAEIARSRLPNLLPTKPANEIAPPQPAYASPTFIENPAFAERVATFRSGTGEARITEVEFIGDDNQPLHTVSFDQPVRIRLHIRLEKDLEFHAGYHLRDEHNLSLLSTGTFTETRTVVRGGAGDRIIVEFATRLPLRHGRYNLLTLISTNYIMNQTAQFADWVENAIVFEMLPRSPQVLWAPIYLPNQLTVWHTQA